MLLSALLSKTREAPPVRLLQAVLNHGLPIVISAEVVAEYRSVLLRARHQRKHGFDAAMVDALIQNIADIGVVAETQVGPLEGPDPKDLHLWAVLRANAQAVLITGDQALRISPPVWAAGRVFTPREWWDQFGDRFERERTVS